MFTRIRSLALAAAAAAMVSFMPAASQAALVVEGNNVFTGTLAANQNLGAIDLADGSFVFSGTTGAATGGLRFLATNSGSAQTGIGATQVLIRVGRPAGITFTELSFGGNPIVLTPITNGFAAAFSGSLPAQFVMSFTGANTGDSIQVSLAAIPLPAGGLLLISALGGLALLRRRKAAAA